MNAILLSLGTFLSTTTGGLLALRFRDHLHLVLSFTAGVLLGVVSFDLLPEIFHLAHDHGLDPMRAMVALVAGFLVFHALEKFAVIHHAHEEDYVDHHHPRIGMLSALALAAHSFIDGVGIGLGFQVSPAVGLAVGTAVIAHDFCDGLNTVSLMLVHKNTTARSVLMLLLDAVAPILGALSTLLFHAAPGEMLVYLGFFSGFLLYIGASDVLPEAHSHDRSGVTGRLIVLTCLGAAFIFVVTRVA
jgi:ZIP family zinc transporter